MSVIVEVGVGVAVGGWGCYKIAFAIDLVAGGVVDFVPS